jgi:phosphohistidine phosphatase SixA
VPGGSTARALSVLDEHEDDEVILLVTHEPTVRALAGHLSGLGAKFPAFRPSGVAVIHRTSGLIVRFDPSTMSWRDPDDLGV